MDSSLSERLRDSLSCSICGELYTIPSSLSPCGHTFCSECIRRALQKKSECPICRSQQVNVVTNDALGVVLDAFLNHKTKKKDNEEEKTKRTRMALVNYHMIKDQKLKDKLTECGLPLHGTRNDWIARHREYVLQYNVLVERNGSEQEFGSTLTKNVMKRLSTVNKKVKSAKKDDFSASSWIKLRNEILKREPATKFIAMRNKKQEQHHSSSNTMEKKKKKRKWRKVRCLDSKQIILYNVHTKQAKLVMRNYDWTCNACTVINKNNKTNICFLCKSKNS